MQLMVDAPKTFEKELVSARCPSTAEQRRQRVLQHVGDVQDILDQSDLEQGGSFDSDMTFCRLSQKLVENYSRPCLDLVDSCVGIIAAAISRAACTAFSAFPGLRERVLRELGVTIDGSVVDADEQYLAGAFASAPTSQMLLLPFLRYSARHKVLNLLDAQSLMSSVHPFWKHFETLFQNILNPDKTKATKADKDERSKSSPFLGFGAAKVTAFSPSENDNEMTLQKMLDLDSLAKLVQEEGEAGIADYESGTQRKLSSAVKYKVRKHFARVEVMGYIIRMSLISNVFPLVLRDVRDGLFRGISFGFTSFNSSLSQYLRNRLMFDPKVEAKVFLLMEPSEEQALQRQKLASRKARLEELKVEFQKMGNKMGKLASVLTRSSEHPVSTVTDRNASAPQVVPGLKSSSQLMEEMKAAPSDS